MIRPLLWFLALCFPICAQIQVFLFDGANETPIGAIVTIGTATPGDTLTARLRVRDIGAGPALLSTLSLAGTDFQLVSYPSLPYTIAPGAETEFKIAFSPDSIGSYNAFLLVNAVNIIVRGIAAPAAVLRLAGSSSALSAGATIDFGQVVRGASQPKNFTLSNTGASNITVSQLSVSGTGFRGPIGQTAPISIGSGQSVSFQIAFEPLSGQAFQGTLVVDQRTFILTGQGLDPPLPGASIMFASNIGSSAQQNSVSIPLALPAPVSGTGILTLAFHPAVAGVTDDPAVQFVSGAKRSATVSISAGAAVASFGTQSSMGFQTGTTAGIIIFTLTLPNSTQQASLPIAPASVGFDSMTCVRRVGALDVSVTGFDNTYSASELDFTFYDLKGIAIQPGMIHVDATSSFKQYFGVSAVGGTFAVLATFPVNGDTTQIGGVDVQITNSVGATKAEHITF
jgi:hypothetical protein